MTPTSNAVTVEDLAARSQWLRQSLLEMVARHKNGHLPSCLSMTEIMVALYYGGAARIERGKPHDPNRDRILVSKGHAAMAQYPILADFGFFPEDELNKFTQPDGILSIYADYRIPGIEGISGSLGHGIGMGAGMALAARLDGHDHRIFVVLGDGENYEGSIWEAAMFAAHHKLDRLIAIVDRNKLCILGRTDELLGLGDLEAKWRAFGWETIACDGHSYHSLLPALGRAGTTTGKPLCIIADTVKGKGISFMEGRAEWHNRMPNAAQFDQARQDLSVNCIFD